MTNLTFDKVVALITAFTAIAKMVESAQKDGKITPDEIANIILAGVVPVLQLFGVKLPDGVYTKLGQKSTIEFMNAIDRKINILNHQLDLV